VVLLGQPGYIVSDDDKELTVGELGVPPLSGGVPDQVSGPSEQLLDDEVVEDDNGSVTDGLPQLLLTLLRDTIELTEVGQCQMCFA